MKSSKPAYQQIVDKLADGILAGQWQAGQKLPSEAMLVNRFGTSRITVGRAMRELQQRGLIERVAGSGSYVRGSTRTRDQLLFGLLIPDLGETEIFEPICQGIASAPEAGEHALLWGHSDPTLEDKAEQAWQLCEQYVSRKVSGVFFAPLEYETDSRDVNRRILSRFSAANIPVVLLDRRPNDSPERGRPDLVGINNRQAGYLATEHLVHSGCRRIGFVAYHGSPLTINARYTGYRDALVAHGIDPDMDSTPKDRGTLEAQVCVNDRIAGELMHALLASGTRIPEDMRIVGIDDVSYARLLPVPLTTVRQPCREIGAIALKTMLERIERPKTPPREILIDGELVIRKS